MKIFLSHNHEDKPVVEPVALRLREIFGENEVFYDSWSIKLGDGIVQKMNEGLTSPEFVFFFVSHASLASKMVELEWQNALFKATKGKCRIIPIRVDSAEMPPVLLQNLYIDMYSIGIEASIAQIVGVVEGMSSFTPQHIGFSNLSWSVERASENEQVLTISASHFMEPNALFAILAPFEETELNVSLPDHGMAKTGYNKSLKMTNGTFCSSFNIGTMGGAITPTIPLRIKIINKTERELSVQRVLHQKALHEFRSIPFKKANEDK